MDFHFLWPQLPFNFNEHCISGIWITLRKKNTTLSLLSPDHQSYIIPRCIVLSDRVLNLIRFDLILKATCIKVNVLNMLATFFNFLSFKFLSMSVGKHLLNNWLFDPCTPSLSTFRTKWPLMGMSRLAWMCPDLLYSPLPPLTTGALPMNHGDVLEGICSSFK